jgi:hypothetical protein
MTGFPLLPWLALVAVYVSMGRFRGASWRSIATTAIAVFMVVFVEFTSAFMLGLEALLWTGVAVGFGAVVFVAVGKLHGQHPVRHGRAVA